MKITWIGHSCFKVECRGYSVIFDPTEDGYVPGILPIRETADMVHCSHEHGDHNARKCVSLTKSADCPFTIEEIFSYHDDKKGKLRGPNIITIIDDGETRLAHFGDIGCMPEPDQIEKLKGLDAALIPVGGYYTIDGDQAAELCKIIKPRLIIPMHYRDDALGFGFDVIGTTDAFVRKMGGAKVISDSTVDTGSEGAEGVVILRPQNSDPI